MPVQGGLSIERMCRLAGVSRASFYRCLPDRFPVEEDIEVRAAIQQTGLEHPAALVISKNCGRTTTVRDAGKPQVCRRHHAGR
jgi:hypothetical protein